MPQPQTAPDVQDPGSHEAYLRAIVGQLTAALENILGPADAAGFISIAAQGVAATLGPQRPLTRDEMAGVLVEVQQSIGADFYTVSETPNTIVLGNRMCPFGGQAPGRHALCMTTSNILGSIAAKNLGYARVELEKTIAGGDTECLVSIHLMLPDAVAPAKGREYFSSPVTE